MKNYVLLMMGGTGTRMGADIPKQFLEVEGKPIFLYIAEGYENLSEVEGTIIVVHPDWIDYVKDILKQYGLNKIVDVVAGGETRSNSVKNGLIALSKYAEPEDSVLIHDATHPYVDEEGTGAIIEALKEYQGATLGEYQYDTVYKINEEDVIVDTLDRKLVVAGASPEGFIFGRIFDIYNNSAQDELESMTSAGAIAIASGIEMKVVPCNTLNLKITYPKDLDIFQKTVTSYFFRK